MPSPRTRKLCPCRPALLPNTLHQSRRSQGRKDHRSSLAFVPASHGIPESQMLFSDLPQLEGFPLLHKNAHTLLSPQRTCSLQGTNRPYLSTCRHLLLVRSPLLFCIAEVKDRNLLPNSKCCRWFWRC